MVWNNGRSSRDRHDLGQDKKQIRIYPRSQMVPELKKSQLRFRDRTHRTGRLTRFSAASSVVSILCLELSSDYRESFELPVNREAVLQIHIQRSLVIRFCPRNIPESLL